jgi:uncharacterized protein with ParB-like and HNH nuclease domain
VKEIIASARTIRELLKDQRYSIDYYQREYRWQKKQLEELIDDLADQFLHSYAETDSREAVQSYEHYFLGSVIFSRRGNDTFIVDGQQRVTTLTLLLIMLHRKQGERSDRVKLEDLIYSEKYGKRSFNIAVPERSIVMEAIFNGECPEVSDASESVQTIVERYQELELLLPEEINEAALPYFCDWLIDNVHVVEITASTDQDAYQIFETMNDRGLSLTPLDMLKGLLLAKIKDQVKRTEAAKVWRIRIESLRKLGRDDDSDAVKHWLRAKYAQNVRDRHRGAENKDFEKIGTEFHRWVGDNASLLKIESSDDVFRFIHDEFNFFTRQFERLRCASEQPIPGLEPVYHVAAFRFTLQYPLLLAPLCPEDDLQTIDKKIRVVATFLDILLARRAVNYLSMTYASMSYASFLILKEIRGLSLKKLVKTLQKKLEEQGCDFDGTKDKTRLGFEYFGLNQWSKHYIRVFLARITSYVESQSGEESSPAKYLVIGKARYEIEHIWADHYDRYKDEVDSPASFSEWRNSIGGLLLLPKSFNASYGDLPYVNHKQPKKGKLTHYLTQNLLARSLHPQCYEHNPGFLKFVKDSGIPFRSHNAFTCDDINERQALYRAIADRIWDPNLLTQELSE